MTENHTAGPWRAEGPDEFGDYNIHHPADALAVAAAVRNGRPDEEVEANARLIAAAPELLAAVEYVRLIFGRRLVSRGQKAEAIRRIDAALAKVGTR